MDRNEIASQIIGLLNINEVSEQDKWWLFAKILEDNLMWSKTPQGSTYWQTVSSAMLAASSGPHLLQKVCTKEEVEIGPITIKANTSGTILCLDPLRVMLEGMPSLTFSIPLEKLRLQ